MLNSYYGGCHCKAVQFSFKSESKVSIIKCDCSICAPLEYQHLIISKDNFYLIRGKSFLTNYKFETNQAEHLFCKVCGTKSYYVPRSHKNSFSINLRCVSNPPTIIKEIIFRGSQWEKNINNLLKES